jgi:hypothetical protein
MVDCNNGLLIRGHGVQRPAGSCSSRSIWKGVEDCPDLHGLLITLPDHTCAVPLLERYL